jgi:hypothetical protein
MGLPSEKAGIRGYAFATALHVVQEVLATHGPLKIRSASGETVFEGKWPECEIFPLGSAEHDTALVFVMVKDEFLSQVKMLPTYPWDSQLPRGAEIGWVGFPALAQSQYCFFKGVISGYLNSPPTYLVDGVATNGVSGGPALDDRAHIVGLVSSYIPNRLDEHTSLPGMLALVPINTISYWLREVLKARVL